MSLPHVHTDSHSQQSGLDKGGPVKEEVSKVHSKDLFVSILHPPSSTIHHHPGGGGLTYVEGFGGSVVFHMYSMLESRGISNDNWHGVGPFHPSKLLHSYHRERKKRKEKKMSAAVARTEGAAAGAEEEFLVPFMAGSKRKGRSKKC